MDIVRGERDRMRSGGGHYGHHHLFLGQRGSPCSEYRADHNNCWNRPSGLGSRTSTRGPVHESTVFATAMTMVKRRWCCMILRVVVTYGRACTSVCPPRRLAIQAAMRMHLKSSGVSSRDTPSPTVSRPTLSHSCGSASLRGVLIEAASRPGADTIASISRVGLQMDIDRSRPTEMALRSCSRLRHSTDHQSSSA